MTPHELKIFATHIGFLYRANRERDFDEFRLSFNRCPSVEVTVKKGEYFFDGVCVGNVRGAAEAYAKIVSAMMDPLLAAADVVLDEVGKLYPPIEVSDHDFAKAIDQLAKAVNDRRNNS